MGRRADLRLRPRARAVAPPRPGLRDRHAAADGERQPAHRARLQLHPHRLHGPLQADAGARGVLPDRLGRQRPADRAPRPELLRRARRRDPPLRGGLHPALPGGRRRQRQGDQGRRPAPDQPQELHRAVRRAHRRGRGHLRGALPPDGLQPRLGHLLPHHRRALPRRRPAGLPAQPRARRGLPGRGTGTLGRHLPDGRRPGRARGPRLPRRLPPGRLRPPRRDAGPHRDDPTRAASRRSSRSSRTPTTSATATSSARPSPRRSSGSRCPSSPTRSRRWTRAPASPCAARSATSPT